MFCTAKLNMAKTVPPMTLMSFLTTQHGQFTLKASPGVAIFGHDMLFNIPFIANWNKIGDYRQCQTDLNMARKDSKQVDYDYKVGNKVLLTQEDILRKAESPYSRKP